VTLLRQRVIDTKASAMQLNVTTFVDRVSGVIFILIIDETETFRHSSLSIDDHHYALYFAVIGHEIFQLALSRRARQTEHADNFAARRDLSAIR
jgi:hypothetical protein